MDIEITRAEYPEFYSDIRNAIEMLYGEYQHHFGYSTPEITRNTLDEIYTILPILNKTLKNNLKSDPRISIHSARTLGRAYGALTTIDNQIRSMETMSPDSPVIIPLLQRTDALKKILISPVDPLFDERTRNMFKQYPHDVDDIDKTPRDWFATEAVKIHMQGNFEILRNETTAYLALSSFTSHSAADTPMEILLLQSTVEEYLSASETPPPPLADYLRLYGMYSNSLNPVGDLNDQGASPGFNMYKVNRLAQFQRLQDFPKLRALFSAYGAMWRFDRMNAPESGLLRQFLQRVRRIEEPLRESISFQANTDRYQDYLPGTGDFHSGIKMGFFNLTQLLYISHAAHTASLYMPDGYQQVRERIEEYYNNPLKLRAFFTYGPAFSDWHASHLKETFGSDELYDACREEIIRICHDQPINQWYLDHPQRLEELIDYTYVQELETQAISEWIQQQGLSLNTLDAEEYQREWQEYAAEYEEDIKHRWHTERLRQRNAEIAYWMQIPFADPIAASCLRIVTTEACSFVAHTIYESIIMEQKFGNNRYRILCNWIHNISSKPQDAFTALSLREVYIKDDAFPEIKSDMTIAQGFITVMHLFLAEARRSSPAQAAIDLFGTENAAGQKKWNHFCTEHADDWNTFTWDAEALMMLLGEASR